MLCPFYYTRSFGIRGLFLVIVHIGALQPEAGRTGMRPYPFYRGDPITES
jgi:hypothetical protein